MDLVLVGADVFATIGSFLRQSPLAVCNLVCRTWRNDNDLVSAEYYTTSLSLLEYADDHVNIWNPRTCSSAAGNGQLACLQFLHEYGCEWDRWTCGWAAQNGHLDC